MSFEITRIPIKFTYEMSINLISYIYQPTKDKVYVNNRYLHMKLVLVLGFLWFLSGPATAAVSQTSDSLRLEVVDGKQFIIHKVEPKETLYGISKRYGVSIEDITTNNTSALEGLKIGEELSIPVLEAGNSVDSPEELNHLVDIGETLYSISRKYGVRVDDLKTWNQLTSNDLDVGQRLTVKISSIDETTPLNEIVSSKSPDLTTTSKYHIVTQKETLFAISQEYGVKVEDLRRWNNLESNDIAIGQRLIVTQAEDEVPVSESTPDTTSDAGQVTLIELKKDTVVENVPEEDPVNAEEIPVFNSRTIKDGDLEKVLEQGMARVIANSTHTRKYLALHRTADVGTVMKVMNMMNQLSIYVRVVGKLPDTGENDRVLLKMSRTAYERLGGVDEQFPVEVTYIP